MIMYIVFYNVFTIWKEEHFIFIYSHLPTYDHLKVTYFFGKMWISTYSRGKGKFLGRINLSLLNLYSVLTFQCTMCRLIKVPCDACYGRVHSIKYHLIFCISHHFPFGVKCTTSPIVCQITKARFFKGCIREKM